MTKELMASEPLTLDGTELTSNTPSEPGKRWGWVSARPSEFLVVYRRGRLAQRLCGQGGRFFKWPSDSYVLIPTTLKEVVFQANQITRDHVDVKLRGMVVYRIATPLVIYPLINFADRANAEAKLARMIADICRSTVKWLVANMTLSECIQRRKEEIAGALRTEISAIATATWGVEVVTVDVQDVFIQDDGVFRAMQATFKAEKDREAKLAQQQAERAIEESRLAHERSLEKDRQDLALEKAQRAGDLELARLAHEQRRSDEQFKLDTRRVEQAREIALFKARQAEEQSRIAGETTRLAAQLAAEAAQFTHDEEAAALRARLAAESGAGRASLERLFIQQALPQVAVALAKGLENARLHLYQSDGKPGAGFLPVAMGQVMELLSSAASARTGTGAARDDVK